MVTRNSLDFRPPGKRGLSDGMGGDFHQIFLHTSQITTPHEPPHVHNKTIKQQENSCLKRQLKVLWRLV